MNINKIREALEAAIIEPGLRKSALAELDKAPKVLTDEEIERVANTQFTHATSYSVYVQRESWKIALRHARDNGYLAPAAGLTVKSITLVGEQPDPAGDIKVMVELSNGTEVEAIRTCANSIYHMVTVAGIIEEHARLTAAIEAKTNNK